MCINPKLFIVYFILNIRKAYFFNEDKGEFSYALIKFAPATSISISVLYYLYKISMNFSMI